MCKDNKTLVVSSSLDGDPISDLLKELAKDENRDVRILKTVDSPDETLWFIAAPTYLMDIFLELEASQRSSSKAALIQELELKGYHFSDILFLNKSRKNDYLKS